MSLLAALSELNYLTLPLLGGIGIALMAGPLGAIMVWRRLSYFGDTLAHSSLLGVTLAFIMQVNLIVGVCVIGVSVAFLLLKWEKRLALASDTLLGLISHSALALGLLALATQHQIKIDILGFLYGDILAITRNDIFVIYIGGVFVCLLLAFLWQSLLRIIIHRELAQVEGIQVEKISGAYLLLLALVIALSIKIIGALLITALLITPAASMRAWSRTPEQMATLSSFVGVFSVMGGIGLSHCWDLPTGPSIVTCAFGIFLASHLIHAMMVE